MNDNELFQAAAGAIAAFGIDARELFLVARAENLTFKAVDGAGTAYALRLHRPGYHTLDELEAERLWTDALLQGGVRLPRNLSAPDGRHYIATSVGQDESESRWASLAEWINGTVLLPILRDPATPPAQILSAVHAIGALVARMHRVAIGWQAPAHFDRRRLDADGLMGADPYWGRFWECKGLTPGQRTVLNETRLALHAHLVRYGAGADRFGVIHADLHPGNIMVEGDTLTAIDFDDTAYGWFMYDLAIVLHQCQDLILFPQLYAACLAGYRTVRDLAPEDVEMIPVFLLVRGIAEIGWFAERPELTTPEEQRTLTDFAITQCEAYKNGTLAALCLATTGA